MSQPLEKRPAFQGLFGAMYGVASIVGPLMGECVTVSSIMALRFGSLLKKLVPWKLIHNFIFSLLAYILVNKSLIH